MEDLFGISKSSVKTIVKEVSFLISTRLRNRFIVMPSTNDEILRTKVDFMRWANFPLCIGAVDGTHIDIRSFGGDDAELYRDRHLRFSLNVQLTVSADVRKNVHKHTTILLFTIVISYTQERILDVVSRWPGSAHDATIFKHSNICNLFGGGTFGLDTVLVVDSAYPPEPFLCKPLSEANIETPNERRYQHCQIKARNVVERVNGQLKRMFPVLQTSNESRNLVALKIYFEFNLDLIFFCSNAI